MTESELRAMVSLLDDDDHEVVSHIEERIYTMGTSMIPYLEELWKQEFNPLVQKKIEDIVHKLQFENLKQRLRAWKDQPDHDLLTGMWLVATYQYPDLDISSLQAKLQQLYFEAWLDFKNDIAPYDQIRILNNVFFNKLKFKANTSNFHAVANSMLNNVIESRRGNPISLCVIYMLIARQLKMPVFGVNLPNLFILTYKNDDLQFYINTFNRGLVFSRRDIDNYIAQLNITANDSFYEPCKYIDIIRRVLRNLIVSYEKLSEPEKVNEVKVLLETISDESSNSQTTDNS